MKKILFAFGVVCFVGMYGVTPLSADPVKIGGLFAESGTQATIARGEIIAVKMAAEEYGPVLGEKVEVIIKDHAFNPGMAVEKAKELFEREKVDAIVGCANSAASLAVCDQAQKNKKVFLATDGESTELIARNPYTIKWAGNDYMKANSVGLWGADNLGKRWYTITVDYAFGHDLLKHFTAALQKKGGTHLGNDMVPFGTSDYSPYILKAIKADPDVLLLLNVGKDTQNSARAAFEYGLKKKTKIVHALLFEVDIKDSGLGIFSGNYVAVPWYWQASIPGAKEFADRFQKRAGERPHYGCAANYSATWQYLDAVKRAGTKETIPVIKALRGHTFRDIWANPGTIRAEDQLQVSPVYILRAKTPDQLKEKEDYFDIVGILTADQAHPGPNLFGRKLGDF